MADDENARQEAMRRAGQEYFDRVLAGAVAGADPPGPAGAAGPSAARGPPTSVKVTGTALLREAGRTPSASRYSVQRAQGEAREAGGSGRGRLFDQDLLALEDFLQGSKEWVILGLFVLFTATSMRLCSTRPRYTVPCAPRPSTFPRFHAGNGGVAARTAGCSCAASVAAPDDALLPVATVSGATAAAAAPAVPTEPAPTAELAPTAGPMGEDIILSS